MQIVSNIALISINETLIVQLISFLIFLFIINRIMFRPLRESMREREQYIEGIRMDITDAEKELQTVAQQTRDENAAVRKAGLQMTADLEEKGNQEAGEIIAAARQKIAQLSHKSKKEIETQVAEARKAITAEAGKLSVSIMEKVLDRRLAS